MNYFETLVSFGQKLSPLTDCELLFTRAERLVGGLRLQGVLRPPLAFSSDGTNVA